MVVGIRKRRQAILWAWEGVVVLTVVAVVGVYASWTRFDMI
jgi:hypothetical protein